MKRFSDENHSLTSGKSWNWFQLYPRFCGTFFVLLFSSCCLRPKEQKNLRKRIRKGRISRYLYCSGSTLSNLDPFLQAKDENLIPKDG